MKHHFKIHPWIMSVSFLTPIVLSLSKARNLNFYVIKIDTELKTLTALAYTLQFPKSTAKIKRTLDKLK